MTNYFQSQKIWEGLTKEKNSTWIFMKEQDFD